MTPETVVDPASAESVPEAASSRRGRMYVAARDPLVINAATMLTTTLLMAAAGTVFWILAARLASPSQVGIASSLVAAAEALGFFAQLGLNVSLVRSMPRSSRPAADVTTAAVLVAVAGGGLALTYCAVLPLVAPDVARTVTWLLVPVFALLVAGSAVNQLTDAIFLAVDRVVDNLVINGIVLSVLRVTTPLALGAAGALALFGLVGGTSFLAAVLSVWAILRRLPDRPRLRPSRDFARSRQLALAGYLTNCLLLAPQLVIPLIVISAMGASSNAVFFISFQVVNLLNHAIYTVGNSTYAEVARNPARTRAIVSKGGATMVLAVVIGAGLLAVLAPALLAVFGQHYAAHGVPVLRLLAAGAAGVAVNYGAAVRLRIAQHGAAMVGAQLLTTVLTIALAAWAAHWGLLGIALGWGGGQLAGGAVGWLLARRVAPLRVDEEVRG